MNKCFFVFVVFYCFSFQKTYSQTTAQLKEQSVVLNDSINKLKIEVKRLLAKDSSSQLEIKNQKKMLILSNDTIASLTKVVKEINNLWIRDLLFNKYQMNESYFLNKDISKDDDKIKISKIDACAKSLIVEGVKGDTLKICQKVIEFHKIYYSLSNIQEKVLTQKFDSLNNINAINEIDQCQKLLDKSTKLYITSMNQKDLLLNYKSRSLQLKSEELDKLKNVEQTAPFTIKKYNDLLKDVKYIKYDYLMKIIKEMKNDVNSYTEDDL
jgi:hypothetical protein